MMFNRSLPAAPLAVARVRRCRRPSCRLRAIVQFFIAGISNSRLHCRAGGHIGMKEHVHCVNRASIPTGHPKGSCPKSKNGPRTSYRPLRGLDTHVPWSDVCVMSANELRRPQGNCHRAGKPRHNQAGLSSQRWSIIGEGSRAWSPGVSARVHGALGRSSAHLGENDGVASQAATPRIDGYMDGLLGLPLQSYVLDFSWPEDRFPKEVPDI